jgi:hypothetical protein
MQQQPPAVAQVSMQQGNGIPPPAIGTAAAEGTPGVPSSAGPPRSGSGGGGGDGVAGEGATSAPPAATTAAGAPKESKAAPAAAPKESKLDTLKRELGIRPDLDDETAVLASAEKLSLDVRRHCKSVPEAIELCHTHLERAKLCRDRCRTTLAEYEADRASGKVTGAGFEVGGVARQLSALDFGKQLHLKPMRAKVLSKKVFPSVRRGDPNGRRQVVLAETLLKLQEASSTAKYHTLARENVDRWKQVCDQQSASAAAAAAGVAAAAGGCGCQIHVLPGDWGEVTLQMTKTYGQIFASLNMANAYGPGGGYTDGMVAQEENMYRRTDCHYSLHREEVYGEDMSTLINGELGRVYLDARRPRVCLRGPEDRHAKDLGYPWLPDHEVFLFFELRSAAVDLRMSGRAFVRADCSRRVAAQLDTLIDAGVRHAVFSAFGCGAFRNPAAEVASIYRWVALSQPSSLLPAR